MEDSSTMSIKDKEEVVTILISISTRIDKLETELRNAIAVTFFLAASVGGLILIKWAIEAWRYAYGG